jgi:hypothetical protein
MSILYECLLKYDDWKLTIAETVKSRERIFSVKKSTFRRVLQKMTALVIDIVS